MYLYLRLDKCSMDCVLVTYVMTWHKVSCPPLRPYMLVHGCTCPYPVQYPHQYMYMYVLVLTHWDSIQKPAQWASQELLCLQWCLILWYAGFVQPTMHEFLRAICSTHRLKLYLSQCCSFLLANVAKVFPSYNWALRCSTPLQSIPSLLFCGMVNGMHTLLWSNEIHVRK
jgi:hypothetical protein